MKINLLQEIKQLSGESMVDNDGEGNAVKATLKMVICNALLTPLQKDSQEKPMDKYLRGKLTDKIYSADEIDLAVDEAALIKERIGLNPVFGALVVTRAWDILEGKI